MAYTAPGTVTAGDVATAAAWNVVVNDVIDLNSRVTSPAGTAVNDTATQVLTTSYASVLAVTITLSGTRPVLINWTVSAQNAVSGADRTAQFQLYAAGAGVGINTGTITVRSTNDWISTSGSYIETPASGSRTYAIYGLASLNSAVNCRNRMLTVTEI
jgi:hypothetical protein